MSDNAANEPQAGSDFADKGKGKQVEQYSGGTDDMHMDDEEDSDEESGQEEEHPEEPDEDNMEEIDQDNIVGDRTRGKVIDWNEAEQKSREAGDEFEEDEDDEDDEDFEDPDAEMED